MTWVLESSSSSASRADDRGCESVKLLELSVPLGFSWGPHLVLVLGADGIFHLYSTSGFVSFFWIRSSH